MTILKECTNASAKHFASQFAPDRQRSRVLTKVNVVVRASFGEQPEPGDIEPLLDHYKHIFCKGDEVCYEYLLNILAHVVQKPTIKTKVMVGLRSKYQGAGKNLGISHLQAIIGRKHSTALSNAKHVIGDFNAMLSGKTLVILDEAIWGGMKKDKSSIKTLISEPRIPIRLMRTDAYEEDSYHFIMAFSNEKNF